MNEKKNYQLEVLRVISCIFVIVIHVSNCYRREFMNTSDMNYMVSVLWNVIARVSVPVFFMLSGATMLRCRYGLKKYIKKVVKMFAVVLGWSLFYYIWNKLYMNRDYSIHDMLETPVKLHLWYLYAYIGILLILPFLQSAFSKLETKYEMLFAGLWISVMLVYRVAAFYDFPITYDVPLIGTTYYVGYFVMGHLIYKHLPKLSEVAIKNWVLRCIMYVSMACSFGLTCYYSMTKMKDYGCFLQYRDVFIIINSMTFFLYIVRMNAKPVTIRQKDPIKLISKASFMIYLVHPLFLDILKTNIAYQKLSAIVIIPLATTIIFSCSLLTSYIGHKVTRKLKTWFHIDNLNRNMKNQIKRAISFVRP